MLIHGDSNEISWTCRFWSRKNTMSPFVSFQATRSDQHGICTLPLNPSIRWCCDGPRSFRRALNWAPMLLRDLSDRYISDNCCFTWLITVEFVLENIMHGTVLLTIIMLMIIIMCCLIFNVKRSWLYYKDNCNKKNHTQRLRCAV